MPTKIGLKEQKKVQWKASAELATNRTLKDQRAITVEKDRVESRRVEGDVSEEAVPGNEHVTTSDGGSRPILDPRRLNVRFNLRGGLTGPQRKASTMGT